MSEQEEFDANFEKLTPTQVRVLEQLLLGRLDRKIAANFQIEASTVRKYVENICDALYVEKKGGSSRRSSLVTLIAKYKPELIKDETPSPPEIEPQPNLESFPSIDPKCAGRDNAMRDLDPELVREPVTSEEAEPPSNIDPKFVGRGDAMRDLDNLVNQGAKCILILSPGGRGKTTLAWRYLESRFSPEEILYFPIAKETKDIASVESLVEERLRKLGEEPGREFMVSLERLREKLTEKPMGVLIDNLEPALDEFYLLGSTLVYQKNTNKAFSVFNNLLKYSENNYFSQGQGFALMGLGAVKKLEKQYLKSINLYQDSIRIFSKIGAKCDLAEAYYQLALTQQKMGNSESETHFNKAIELWTEIDAPKQIERIRNSMNNPPD